MNQPSTPIDKRRGRFQFADLLPAGLKPWYQAARPRSLPATYVPLLIGGALAFGDNLFSPVRFTLALIGALLLQIASNFINEYVDYARGTDEQKTDGMGMVLTRGQLTPGQVRAGAILTVVGGSLIGLLLVLWTGPVLLFVGLFGVLVVVSYTAGPLPLSYIGLGEIAVFFAMGPLMTFGTYYAVAGVSSWQAFLAGMPIAFTVAAILHANNMRDIEADRLAKKRTLAVILGLRGARIEFIVLVYGAYVATLALVLAGVMPWTTLLAWITIPEAIWLVRVTTRTEKPAALHRAQGRTARLHFWIGVALTIGWILHGAYILL